MSLTDMDIPVIYIKNRTVDDIDGLFAAMRTRSASVLVEVESNHYSMAILQSIQREDGSGKSFNVRVLMHDTTDDYRDIYIKVHRTSKKGSKRLGKPRHSPFA
jgi:hypothetical protein